MPSIAQPCEIAKTFKLAKILEVMGFLARLSILGIFFGISIIVIHGRDLEDSEQQNGERRGLWCQGGKGTTNKGGGRINGG